eukprot:364743-Chlamydomonas_euryale.AAC.7
MPRDDTKVRAAAKFSQWQEEQVDMTRSRASYLEMIAARKADTWSSVTLKRCPGISLCMLVGTSIAASGG